MKCMLSAILVLALFTKCQLCFKNMRLALAISYSVTQAVYDVYLECTVIKILLYTISTLCETTGSTVVLYYFKAT